VSKNEAVCCAVQAHLGSFRLSRFTEKILGAFSRFSCPKTKRFAVLCSAGASWKFSPFKVYRKNSGRIFSIFVSKNEAVCCEVQAHF